MISIKKIISSVIFNFALFSLLIIGIQNSSQSRKVNLLMSDTVKLPTSFIIGVSFITGSIVGSLLSIGFQNKKH
tara:strand:- start:139 stop:360 length:222 start_codon:yes stop_codon:yes gene_type:complete